jgi:hypothetical protein
MLLFAEEKLFRQKHGKTFKSNRHIAKIIHIEIMYSKSLNYTGYFLNDSLIFQISIFYNLETCLHFKKISFLKIDSHNPP